MNTICYITLYLKKIRCFYNYSIINNKGCKYKKENRKNINY